MNKPSFAQSRETQIIYDIFLELPTRNPPLLTYRELLKETGKKDIAEIRGFISTAIRRARRLNELVIECDRGVGYRLRPDNELADCGLTALSRARKIQKTGGEKLGCVKLTKLSADEKIKHFVAQSAIELALVPSRPRTLANITDQVKHKHNSLDNDVEMLLAIQRGLTS
jgi:hypothetical protein